MFRKVLVATDLSEASNRVIGCLHGLKPLGAEEAILVHALGLRHLTNMKTLLARYVEANLAAQKALLEDQGFQTTAEVAPGTAVLEINRIAAERHASLIVVGTHGSGLLRETLMGRTAMGILHHARCPMLVIPVRITEEDELARCEAACLEFGRHVLYCTDFSDTAERAFLYVQKIVECCGGRVTLLHVQDETRIGKHLKHRLEEFNQIDRERLERLEARLLDKGAAEVAIEVRYGSPIREILRVAAERTDSLLVMGSQGRGFLAEVFLGSTSHQVVRRSPVPVLLVPAVR